MPFVIRHKDPADGREFKLDSVKVFDETYKPQGFVIVKPQPVGGELPEMPRPKAERPKDDDKKDGKA